MKRLNFNIFSRYREVLMGMAILSILIFHYTEDCFNIGINYSGIVKLYKTYISSSGVDIFLLLSGLGLYYSFSKNNNLKEFYSKRIRRILVPYLMIGIPVYFWYDFVYLSDGIIGFIKNISFITLFTQRNILFWYIFFIIVCYLIFPLIYKLIYKDKGIASLIKISLIIGFLAFGIYLINFYYPHLFSQYEIMLLRFIPFILGILIGKYSYENKKISYYGIPLILGILSFLLIKRTGMFSRFFVFTSNFSLMFLIIIIFDYLMKKNNLIIKYLSFLGKYSLEIYLVHVSIRKIILSNGYPNHEIGWYILFVIISIIASVMINRMIEGVRKNQ